MKQLFLHICIGVKVKVTNGVGINIPCVLFLLFLWVTEVTRFRVAVRGWECVVFRAWTNVDVDFFGKNEIERKV